MTFASRQENRKLVIANRNYFNQSNLSAAASQFGKAPFRVILIVEVLGASGRVRDNEFFLD